MFSLFYSVWNNPDSKIYQIVKYLLQMSSETSRTWSSHIKYLSKMYDMEDPFVCLNRDAPEKSVYKKYVSDKITSFHERELRTAAAKNSKMIYLNVNLYGLTGRCHPSISSNIITTDDVKIMRPHLKMLGGDYLTYQIKSQQSGGSPQCRLCLSGTESISHIVYSCI